MSKHCHSNNNNTSTNNGATEKKRKKHAHGAREKKTCARTNLSLMSKHCHSKNNNTSINNGAAEEKEKKCARSNLNLVSKHPHCNHVVIVIAEKVRIEKGHSHTIHAIKSTHSTHCFCLLYIICHDIIMIYNYT